MKSKYDTLFCVVNYVKNESEDSVTELLLMGFTPCQLVYEFGFNETEVRKSPVFSDIEDIAEGKLDETEYPFLLDSFSIFDAALVSRFELTKEQLLLIKNTALYQRMKEKYSEEKIEMLTEVTNNVFDVFERAVINEIM